MSTMIQKSVHNVPFITSFIRYNAAALTASACDFGMTILCREIFGMHYLVSVFLGALCGGMVAFTMGRYWTYISTEEKPQIQGMRYVVIWGGSILMNTVGVYILADVLGLGEQHYLYWKIIVAVLVGAFYNFPMQRYFVFK